MELKSLKVNTRDGRGTGKARRIRQQGLVPAVLYGGGQSPLSLTLELKEFTRLVHGRGGEHAVLQLEVQNAPNLSAPALLKEVQHHAVRGQIVHADFQRISLEERITTLVPVELVGRAVGVVEGGVLELVLRDLEVECRALDVPERISIDVTSLDIGDSIHVAAVSPPANVTIVTDPERTVVAVHAPRVVATEEAAPEVEGEGAEPEVIGEKKAEEEGE